MDSVQLVGTNVQEIIQLLRDISNELSELRAMFARGEATVFVSNIKEDRR